MNDRQMIHTANIHQLQALTQLRSEARLLLITGFGVMIGVALLLTIGGAGSFVPLWALIAIAGFIYETVLLWRGLKDNHFIDDMEILPGLGIATWVTALRGIFLAMLGGFILVQQLQGWLSWLPGVFYLIAGVADYLDGYLARKTNYSTVLGQTLDLELDAFGILVAPLLGVVSGKLPLWYLLVSLSRYLFAGGLVILKRRGIPTFDLTPSTRRRQWAGFQMGLVGIALLPIYTAPASWIAASVFMMPFLTGFLRDWLVVSGAVDASSKAYISFIEHVRTGAFNLLPLFLRLIAVASTWVFMYTSIEDQGILVAIISITLILILLGVTGRILALMALLWVGWQVQSQEFTLLSGIVVASLSALVVMGTGVFSLWQPEEIFLNRRAGETHG